MEKPELLQADTLPLLEQCLAIRKQVFSVEKGIPHDIDRDEYDRPDSPCLHYLIRFQGENVGTLRCLPLSGNTIRIQRFCFYKSFRGLGLGRAVMEEIEQRTRRDGTRTIVLDAKCAVSGFYEKCGYRAASGVFWEAGVEHIKMEKAL